MKLLGCALVVCMAAVSQVAANPKGPPLRACATMTPGKAHQPNTLTDEEKENPPFEVAATKSKKNSQVKVFVRALNEETPFRGFMLMAEADGERGHGYFVPSVESKNDTTTMDCLDMPSNCPDEEACQGTANAISHNHNDEKTGVTVIWTPPSNFTGDVSFVATFVGENRKDISTYWLNVRSDPVHVVHV